MKFPTACLVLLIVPVIAGLAACGADSSEPGDPPDPDGTPGDPPPGPVPVRFVIMGDTGEGNEAQYQVGEAVRQKCAADGCDFVVLLGDNIYDDGVDSVDDPQWQEKFELPYRDLDLPFFVALGNHDYGGQLLFADWPGMGNEWHKGPIEVQYSDVSARWTMPATHYTFTWENVGFIMLDTNSIMWDETEHGDQRDWYPTALLEVAGADWVFAAGHHPYLSNGSHGNAGNYESIEVGGVEVPNPVPIMNGGNVRDFFDEVVCGTVDIYFAGHDHNRQWLDEREASCGAELVVSGAGSKTKALEDRGNRVLWQDDQMEGFLYLVVEGTSLRGQFVDRAGAVDFEHAITK